MPGFAGIAAFTSLPPLQIEDRVGADQGFRVAVGDQHPDACLVRERGQQHHDRLLLDEREVARRAVGEQQPGLDHDRARDRDALALAVGELVEHRPRALLGLAGRERLAGAPCGAAMVAPVDEQRHRDVVEHLQPGLGALRRPDARDLTPAQAHALARGQLVESAAVVGDPTAVGCLQPRGDLQQRGLARAAGPVHAEDLSTLELERYVGERELAGAAGALEAL